MTYSAESYLDVLNYNIRKYILNQDVKLEDDRDANNLLKNQFLHPEELQEAIIKLLNIESLQETFTQFANGVPFYGKVFVNNDCRRLTNIINKINRPKSTYGIHIESDLMANNISYKNEKTSFNIVSRHCEQTKINLNLVAKPIGDSVFPVPVGA